MRKWVGVLACAGVLVSCSNNSSNNSGPGVNMGASSLGEIVGDTYAKPCETYTRSRFVIAPGEIAVYVDWFSLPECGGSVAYTLYSNANVVLGEMSDIVPGAQNIDQTATSLGIIPKTQDMVNWLNSDPHCSVAGPFSLNTPTSLAGVQCIMEKAWPVINGATKYTIMLKTETELRLGQSGYICLLGTCYNGATAETRIRELSSTVLTRQY